MKINSIPLKDVLLNVTLGQFQSVPRESEIDHTFSPKFQKSIARTNKKSQWVIWRIWQAPVKRAIIIAVLVVVLLATVMIVRHGVLIPSKPHIPQVVETYYIPTFEPEGFTLFYRDRYNSHVTYMWTNENSEHIQYEQIEGKRDSAGYDMEGNIHTTKVINGLSVEIISNEAVRYFSAVWRDDRYTYTVDIHLNNSDPYPVFEALMNSLVAVGAKD